MGFLAGLVGGLADIGGDLINQQTAENTAQQQAQAAEQLAEQNFKNETGYISNQEQAARDALLGVASSGNPYAAATQDMRGPQALSGGSFGGGSYSGAAGGAQTKAAQNTTPVLGAPQAAPGGSPGPSTKVGNAAGAVGVTDGLTAGLVGAPGNNPSYGTNAQGQIEFNGNSGIPTESSGFFPSLQAAEQAWQAKWGGSPTGATGTAPTAPGSGMITGMSGSTIRPQQGGLAGRRT